MVMVSLMESDQVRLSRDVGEPKSVLLFRLQGQSRDGNGEFTAGQITGCF